MPTLRLLSWSLLILSMSGWGCEPLTDEGPQPARYRFNIAVKNFSARQMRLYRAYAYVTLDELDDEADDIQSEEPANPQDELQAQLGLKEEIAADGTANLVGLTAVADYPYDASVTATRLGSVLLILELLDDDGNLIRSYRFAGWPKRYQELPDIDQYEVVWVKHGLEGLQSFLIPEGQYMRSIDLYITVLADESVTLSLAEVHPIQSGTAP